MRSIWIGATMLALALTGAMAAESDIKLPNDGDDYSKLVARAMAHDASVDFRALRLAYLKSAARKHADGDKLDRLLKEMFQAVNEGESAAPTIRDKAEQILSIDFTDLSAQKLLRQSCAILHDDACADLHHFIEFGLLRSITGTGDGKTCATGWEAFQIKEEYFVLSMMDARMQQQALVSDGGHSCDAMTVTTDDGKTVTYFFKIDVMMADEAAMLGGGH